MDKATLLERRYRIMGEQAPLFYDEPLHIVRGEGVWLYASDGTRYLDVYNNVPHVGHCHPHVVEALSKQAATLNVHSRYLHEHVVEYSERLAATFPGGIDAYMVLLTCTGSEANDTAMRMARMLSGNEGIICTNCAYHGNTEAVWEIGTWFAGGVATSPRIRAVNPPCSYRKHYDLTGEALADAYVAELDEAIASLEAAGLGVAGMLVCTVYSAEGLPDLPPTYLEKAVARIRAAGGYFIADEVQGGFGRTGTAMWGHANHGVEADIATLGKPMGNGHPLAGVVARRELMHAFRDREMYFNTFGSNPVSCAVGMAVLDVIEREDLMRNARETGAYVLDGLSRLAERYPVIGDVRGQGLFFAAEIVRDRAAKTPDADLTKRIVNAMRDHGILISRIGAHDSILKMRPPMPFGREHADMLLEGLDTVLAKVG